jgi:hypothetical protein
MRFSKVILVLGALLLVPGCMLFGGGDDAEVEQEQEDRLKAKNKAKKQAQKGADRPSIDFDPEATVWHYNPIGKRDPFRSFVRGRLDEEIRSPTPLQRYDIDQLAGIGERPGQKESCGGAGNLYWKELGESDRDHQPIHCDYRGIPDG